MAFSLWTTAASAKEQGCTHHAWSYGIIPGYFGMDDNQWVPKTDLLEPLSYVLEYVWNLMREFRDEEPDFCFVVGKKIV